MKKRFNLIGILVYALMSVSAQNINYYKLSSRKGSFSYYERNNGFSTLVLLSMEITERNDSVIFVKGKSRRGDFVMFDRHYMNINDTIKPFQTLTVWEKEKYYSIRRLSQVLLDEKKKALKKSSLKNLKKALKCVVGTLKGEDFPFSSADSKCWKDESLSYVVEKDALIVRDEIGATVFLYTLDGTVALWGKDGVIKVSCEDRSFFEFSRSIRRRLKKLHHIVLDEVRSQDEKSLELFDKLNNNK